MLYHKRISCISIILLSFLHTACSAMPIEARMSATVENEPIFLEEPQFTPQAPECVAPSNPMDGSDLFCRSVVQALTELGLVEVPISVTNMAGGGGSIAFDQAGQSRRDDDDLIIAASPATVLRIAQGKYEPLTVADVRWLGVIAADYGVVAVAADSPFESLTDLIEEIQAAPEAVTFGGGGPIGGQDHMKLMLLAESAGVLPNSLVYIPFEGGGDALNAIDGGYIDVFPGDMSEVLAGVEEGKLRVLAVLTPERVATLPDVPTAIELGYEAQWIIFRGFYGPGGMSDAAFMWWATALEEMAGTAEWAHIRAAAGMDEFFMTGEEFSKMVEQQVKDLAELSANFGYSAGG